MKLIDWCNFNFGNENVRCNFGDVYVKVFRKKSYDCKDMIFNQLMSPNDMTHLFGDYEVYIVGKHTDSGYTTLCVCICKEG